MKTEDLFINKIECCGCELCANICPKSIITLKYDDEGFLYPFIQSDFNCINCKRCLSICPEKNPGRLASTPYEFYGGFIKDNSVVKRSSSGGFATAISRQFIEVLDGIVYGVAYDDNYSVIQFKRATEVKELDQFRTSKYVQANKGDIYNLILEDLRNQKHVLVIGLPCEISAIYHKVGKNSNRLYTISLICHGPTSQKVHQQYIEMLKSKFRSEIRNFSVRHKIKGWKPYYIHAEFDNGQDFNTKFAGSEYDIAFKYLKRESCTNCKYKLGDQGFGILSDLTLGDFHAVQPSEVCYNTWGTSEALIHTSKGKELMQLISQISCLVALPIERIKTGNLALYSSIPTPRNRSLFVSSFVNGSLFKACRIPSIQYRTIRQQLSKKIREHLHSIIESLYWLRR